MTEKKLRVGVVGLRFGSAFAPIYRDHPDVESVALCDADSALLKSYGEQYGFHERYLNFEDMLKSDLDAIHIITPIPLHEEQAVAVLEAGKHCASTVPAAVTLDGLKRIVQAQDKSRKNYMMMETAVYTYQFLYAKKLLSEDKFGRIQFLRGAHYQDMEFWPPYWMGLPPMHYATHAISPLLAIADCAARSVRCLGSGGMREELMRFYGNPYPVETAIYELDRPGLAAEVTRTLFHTAREYMESFNIYGERCSLEWHMEAEDLVQFIMGPADETIRGRRIDTSRIQAVDFSDMLPESIRKHSQIRVIPDPQNPHLSIRQGGGHHGSHPHLVHEFIRSIVENRKPWIDAVRAAEWTAPGICAHISAMTGGEIVQIPKYKAD